RVCVEPYGRQRRTVDAISFYGAPEVSHLCKGVPMQTVRIAILLVVALTAGCSSEPVSPASVQKAAPVLGLGGQGTIQAGASTSADSTSEATLRGTHLIGSGN
ncbi:MAG TPA: hypothetical protein VF263_21310, partial [Longimicrobiaceae bacterium]